MFAHGDHVEHDDLDGYGYRGDVDVDDGDVDVDVVLDLGWK